MIKIGREKTIGNVDCGTGKCEGLRESKIYLNGTATENDGARIVNMAPGIISVASMDAVNGSQLYGLSASVASALGGGLVVSTSGAI